MANEYVNKVVIDGVTKLDLTEDTVTASSLVSGFTAHLASGAPVTGSALINDGVLTVQKNGTTIDTFSANTADNVTVNIEVPTKVSDLNNDSGFISTEVDPVFTASPANDIATTDIDNWNNKVTAFRNASGTLVLQI